MDDVIGPLWPNPGSDAAIELGCECPVLDNAHGWGYMGMEGIFAFNTSCPVHGPEMQAQFIDAALADPPLCSCAPNFGVDLACPVHGDRMFADLQQAIDAVEREAR